MSAISVKRLRAGDRVRMADGGVAEILASRPATWIRVANGKAVDVQYRIIGGGTGWVIADSEDEVNLA